MLNRTNVGGEVKILSSKRGTVNFSINDKITTMPKDMFELVFPEISDEVLSEIAKCFDESFTLAGEFLEHDFVVIQPSDSDFCVAQGLTEQYEEIKTNKLWSVARRVAKAFEEKLVEKGHTAAEVSLGNGVFYCVCDDKPYVTITKSVK